MNELILLCMEMVGTVAFALSGAMTALRRQMDLLGVMILGLITAVGGGVLRDLLLGITPPKVFDDPLTVCVALVSSAAAFLPPLRGLLRPLFRPRHRRAITSSFRAKLRRGGNSTR